MAALVERTGGVSDLVDETSTAASAAQTSADAAQSSADAAQVTANNAVAAAAAAQADANDVWISGELADISVDGSVSAGGRVHLVSPVAGSVSALYITNNSATGAGDTIFSILIGGVAATGSVTLPGSSTAGTVVTGSVTGSVAVGSPLEIRGDGGAASSGRGFALLKITRS